MCKIENCIHRVRRTPTPHRHVGQSWYDHGICSCCAIELLTMRVINGDYNTSQACSRLISEELKLNATKIH